MFFVNDVSLFSFSVYLCLNSMCEAILINQSINQSINQECLNVGYIKMVYLHLL